LRMATSRGPWRPRRRCRIMPSMVETHPFSILIENEPSSGRRFRWAIYEGEHLILRSPPYHTQHGANAKKRRLKLLSELKRDTATNDQTRSCHALSASRSTSPVWLRISASLNSPVAGSPLLECMGLLSGYRIRRGRQTPSTTLAIPTASRTQSEPCSAPYGPANAAEDTCPASALALRSASSFIGP
jgi:hypothetical protein